MKEISQKITVVSWAFLNLERQWTCLFHSD